MRTIPSTRTLFSLAIGIALLAVAGCGGFDCSRAGSCPTDQAPTQTEIAICQARLTDNLCGSEYQDYASCYLDHEQCLPDGDTDQTQTDAQCSTELTSLDTCCNAEPGSASCSAQ